MSQLVGMTQVSWHFTVLKDGAVWQHYGLDSSCWHAGNRANNARLIGIEHEGKAGEPLTEAQTQASVSLVRWIAATQGWPLERHTRLLEHNEVYATACPSGRIPWERYVPENDPNHEDGFDTGLVRLRYEAMLREIVKGHKEAEGDPQTLIDIINGTR
jgi:N-acetyl-anhydromuramyl-L-alanine amidase AmpD